MIESSLKLSKTDKQMNLRDYLTQNGITQAAFGRQLNPPVSQGKVNHWLHGARRVSLIEALQIERLTLGAVTLQDLAQIHAPVSGNPELHCQYLACQHDLANTLAPAGSDIATAAAGQGA